MHYQAIIPDGGYTGSSDPTLNPLNVIDPITGVAINHSGILDGLYDELLALEGLKGQNPETGMDTNGTFMSKYTNRLMGAPYQLLDSVDRRFNAINKYLGNEYMRNFIFNSPILYIKPGMPKYTGNLKETGLGATISNLYMDTSLGGMSILESLFTSIGSSFMAKDKNLQRRMYGFKETYQTYMQHVNYMLRTIANLMGLTSGGGRYPTSVFTSVSDNSKEATSAEPLSSVKWENYRMMAGSQVMGQSDYLASILYQVGNTVISPAKKVATAFISGSKKLYNSITGKIIDGFHSYSDKDYPEETLGDLLKQMDELLSTYISPSTAEGYSGLDEEALNDAWSEIQGSFTEGNDESVSHIIGNKVTTVQFMVEPVAFEESLNNEIGSSMISSAIDGLNSIGQELQWISNSQVDSGILEGLFNFLGGATDALRDSLTSVTEALGGSFLSNLFNGAVNSVKGQKMLYPQIYKSSSSQMNYNFSMTLTTPYGDPYNYFMNIIVPLVHLICLAAPRMVTSNSISSPYLVQAFIPGMCTCQLGIITSMQISKNPDIKHVSVDGYPLTVKVNFTISELYNNLSISPANDPASFMFNETLNDYMCNLAGLMPSLDMFQQQRNAQKQIFEDYFNLTERRNDLSQVTVERIEDVLNPFIGR